MEVLTLSSVALHAIAYNAEQETLEVEFQNGRVYQYYRVPQMVFLDLLAADSKGRFFNRRIRDRYAFMRRS